MIIDENHTYDQCKLEHFLNIADISHITNYLGFLLIQKCIHIAEKGGKKGGKQDASQEATSNASVESFPDENEQKRIIFNHEISALEIRPEDLRGVCHFSLIEFEYVF